MKHKKLTCVTSLVLAGLMLFGSFSGTLVNVLAEDTKPTTHTESSSDIRSDSDATEVTITPEATDATIATDATEDLVVESADEDILIEPDKESSEIDMDASVVTSPELVVQVSGVNPQANGIVVEKVYAAGQTQPVFVKAVNSADADMNLVLSVWTDATAEKPATNCFADVVDGKVQVTLADDTTMDGIVEDNTVRFVLAAGQSVDFELNLSQSAAGSLFANAQFGDLYSEVAEFMWTDAPIDNHTEVPETDAAEEDTSGIVIETDTPNDGFASIYLGDAQQAEVKALNAADFASMRLLMQVDDISLIPNQSDIIGVYDNLYLLSFTSIQQTMNAYVYFKDLGILVEPDVTVEVAGQSSDDMELIVNNPMIPMDTTENPMTVVGSVEDSQAKHENEVIALIDTGVQEHANVIDRVSVVDDKLDGNGHGDAMLEDIVSQNQDAKVLSIRAMDDNGFGTISSLVAAMEYAMEQQVDIINLSLYARTTLTTSVLKDEMQKAMDMGIIVIGAAGNDGVDVRNYVPGSVADAWIIGAAQEDGSRLPTSNFGETVDYNVVAKSTSDATALFTGFVSAHGLDAVAGVLNDGLIYAADFVAEPELPVDPGFSVDTEISDADKVIAEFIYPSEVVLAIGDTSLEEVMNRLPNTVDAILTNGATVSLPATWQCEMTDADAAKLIASSSSSESVCSLAFWMVLPEDYVLNTQLLDESCMPYILAVLNDNSKIDGTLADKFVSAGGVRHLYSSATQGLLKSKSDSAATTRRFHDFLDGDKEVAYCMSQGWGNPEESLDYIEWGYVSSEIAAILDNGYPKTNYFDGVWLPDFAARQATQAAIWHFTHSSAIYPNKTDMHIWNITTYNAKPTWSQEALAAAKWLVNTVAPRGSNSKYMMYSCHTTNGYGYQPVVTSIPENQDTYTSMGISKTWSDFGNKAGLRPSSVTVNLMEAVNSGGYHFKESRQLDASNNWTTRWTDLPLEVDGNKYEYTIQEVVPDNYTDSTVWTGSYENGWTGALTNTIKEQFTSLSIKKEWSDYDNHYNTRPSSIQVELLRKTNGGHWYHYDYATLNEANKWSASWSNLPRLDSSGNLYGYDIQEIPVANYTGSKISWSGDYISGYVGTLTNTVQEGWVKLHKASANPDMTDGNACYDLKGAVYTFYRDKGCTQVVGQVETDSNGDTEKWLLPPGTYYYKETKAPTNGSYELDKNVYSVQVTPQNTADKPVMLNVEDEPGNDPMSITMNKLWTGEKTDTVPSLEGTQFTVEYFDNLTKDVSGKPTRTWVIETQWNDKLQAYKAVLDDEWLVPELSDPLYKDPDVTDMTLLPYGTYKIWESKAAPDYEIEGSLTNKDGSINMDIRNPYITVVDKDTHGNINLQGGNVYTGYDEPVDMSLTLKKFDENGQPLAGVTFKIKSASGYAEKQPDWQSEKTTGTDGIVKWDKIYPDHYTVTEIRTAEGHNLLNEPIEIDLPGRMTEEDAKKYHLVDPDPNDKHDGVVWDEHEKVFYINDPVFEIGNDVHFKLPMTGGVLDWTTFLPLFGGFGTMAGFGAYSVARKRKKRK